MNFDLETRDLKPSNSAVTFPTKHINCHAKIFPEILSTTIYTIYTMLDILIVHCVLN